MTEDVLAVLQRNFRCEHCGACCQIGGNFLMDETDAQNLREFLKSEKGRGIKLDMLCYGTDPITYRFDHAPPCPLWNKTTRFCSCHEFKPQICRDFPFIALRDGKIAFQDLFCCRGAVKALCDYFGVEVF